MTVSARKQMEAVAIAPAKGAGRGHAGPESRMVARQRSTLCDTPDRRRLLGTSQTQRQTQLNPPVRGPETTTCKSSPAEQLCRLWKSDSRVFHLIKRPLPPHNSHIEPATQDQHFNARRST